MGNRAVSGIAQEVWAESKELPRGSNIKKIPPGIKIFVKFPKGGDWKPLTSLQQLCGWYDEEVLQSNSSERKFF